MTIHVKNQFWKIKRRQRSVIFVRSEHGKTIEDEEDVTELVTQINIPLDGGWGWIIVLSSFTSLFILDGNLLSFGILLPDIRDDLRLQSSLIALINSVTYTVYFVGGPIASAVINRYGFRECSMIGSIVCSLALLFSYLSHNYSTLLLCYGFLAGFGACFISMASCLVVGFYFERLRAIALALTACGSSTGSMILSISNNYLVEKVGWRLTVLVQSSMLGCVFFLAMAFKPLTPMYVSTDTETAQVKTTEGTNYIPSIACVQLDDKDSGATERLFRVVSNSRFPTVADLVQSTPTEIGTKAPSTSGKSVPKFTLSAISPNDVDERQLKKVQSVYSKDEKSKKIDVIVKIEPPKRKKFSFARLCKWRQHVPESRPMYRDDVFYNGQITELPIYKKSIAAMSTERFAIEYHLAVTRAARAEDIADNKSVFPRAMRRVLATMIDPALLSKWSFLMICFSAFFFYMGILIPYVYLKDRNLGVGIDASDSTKILSFIGFTSTVGRLIIALISTKISALILYCVSIIISAIAIVAFNFSFNLYYQYVCAGVFGFFVNSLVTLRTIILVELYGLEKLTNAMGICLVFNGIACLIATPVAGVVNTSLGFAASFYMTGFYFFLCGITMLPIRRIARKEITGQEAQALQTPLPDTPRRSSLKKSPTNG